jgi:hypothetical protein
MACMKPGPKQEPEDREVNRGCDEWSNPNGHAEAKGKVEDVAEAAGGHQWWSCRFNVACSVTGVNESGFGTRAF